MDEPGYDFSKFFFDNITGNCVYNASAAQRPKFSYALAIVFGIPASLIIFVTSVGNLFVLCFKARVGKRQTMLLIWNLGLADFLVGTFVLPQGVAYIIGRRWPFGRLMCKIWTSCDLVFCTASIVTLCVISIDRYIGVTRPLRYKMIVTKGRVVAAIVSIWAFSIGVLLATNNYTYLPTTAAAECYDEDICLVSNELKYVVHSVITAFFLPALVTLLLYWKIYTVARQRERGLQQGLMIAIGDNFLSSLAHPLRVHRGNMAQQQKVIKMHKRVAKTLGIVVSVFLVCWLPFFTTYLIGYHCQCIPTIVLDILTWMGYCNSMINPIIYAFTVEEFKESLKSLIMLVAGAIGLGTACSAGQSGRGYVNGNVAGAPSNAEAAKVKKLARSSRAYSTIPSDAINNSNLTNGGTRKVSTGSLPAPPTTRTLNGASPSPSPAAHTKVTHLIPNNQRKLSAPCDTTANSQRRASGISAKLKLELDTIKENSQEYHFHLSDKYEPKQWEEIAVIERAPQPMAPVVSSENLLWSAKSYSVLVNPKVTGL